MSGMAIDEDGDVYFQDDFSDIQEEDFRQLEQSAISFTQQEQAVWKTNLPGPSATLSRTFGSDHVAQHRAQSTTASREQNLARPGLQHVETESFDSNLDENGLPLIAEGPPLANARRVPDEMAQREQWRRDRFAAVQPHKPQHISKPATARAAPVQSFGAYSGVVTEDVRAPSRQLTESITTTAFDEEDALRVKIDELTARLATASDELMARKGEIQIIRAKQAENEKLHQRELGALRKVKQDEADKHKAAMEALNAEKANTISNIQFLKQELNDETRRVEALQRQLRDKPSKDKPTKEKPSNHNTTPKKKASSLRDGFDDEDLMVTSPAISGRRSNKGTPTANRKRKQPSATELKVQPLVLRPSASVSEADGAPAGDAIKTMNSVPIPRTDRESERQLRLVQQVMAFKSSHMQQVLLEHLMKYTFPSDQSRTFSSIVLTEISKLRGKRLPGDLIQIFLSLWAKALQEKYFVCLKDLTDVINFILETDPFVVDTEIVKTLLPLIQSTVNTNAVARFHIIRKDLLTNGDVNKQGINKDIDCTACLDLLYTVACLITDETELLALFWRLMGTDFVLTMLNAAQPPTDISLMLQLLATSILPETFGNICVAEEQVQMESYIVDRICFLLWENLKTIEGEIPYSRKQICHLRLEALSLLTKLTISASGNPYDPSSATNHGTVFLANHPTAIARLVRSAYDELHSLYQLSPSTQALHAQQVNTVIHILYFVLNSPAGKQVDIYRKLQGTNGGAHRHRVVLTRLAFSEGIYIDRGISDDTVRMATDLLEDFITPDEADDLTAVFAGNTGRKVGSASASASGIENT